MIGKVLARLNILTLGVRDLPKVRAFYEALGWESRLSNEWTTRASSLTTSRPRLSSSSSSDSSCRARGQSRGWVDRVVGLDGVRAGIAVV